MDTKSYIDTIDNELKAGSHLLSAAAVPGQIMPSTFCTAWPFVKPILAAVGGMVAWVPVYGAVASLVLGGLVKIADDLYATGCVTIPVPPQ